MPSGFFISVSARDRFPEMLDNVLGNHFVPYVITPDQKG
jgi:hypothetical protein